MREKSPAPTQQPSLKALMPEVGKVAMVLATLGYIGVWSGLFTPPTLGFGTIVDVLLLSIVVAVVLAVVGFVGFVLLGMLIFRLVESGVERVD